MTKSKSWYPGHMIATQKVIRELAPYLTAFVEVVDARAPELTRHQPMDQWVGRAKRVVVLNKMELAEARATESWLDWYRSQGVIAVALNATTHQSEQQLRAVLKQSLDPPYRLAVVGLPNLGKSTLLNRMVGKHRVATGAKPGVTRGPQWIRLPGGWEWLDLPGVVTPSKSKDWRLKLLGVVPVAPEELEEMAERAWQWMFPGADANRDWEEWGRSRGYLMAGGRVDLHRTAQAVLIAVRDGAFGRHSLEWPPHVP